MDSFLFEKAKPADREEIIAFGNLVFGGVYGTMDFAKVLPKLYGPQADTSECHYVARCGGRIAAMIGAFPGEMEILGRRLGYFGVGTVSTHPDFRGKGLMKELFRIALADMEREGAAFSLLGGQRQRYEHFGYEPCGVLMDFHVTRRNLAGLVSGGGRLTAVPLECGDSRMADAVRLHDSRPMHAVRRPEDFYTVCISWQSIPYLLLENGEFRGYFIASEDGKSLGELELTETSLLPDALAAWFAVSGEERVGFAVPLFEREKAALLDSFCDWCALEPAHSFRVIDFESTVRALMALKASGTGLASGRFVLEVRDVCRIAVEVAGKAVSVARTDSPADLALTRLDAERFLFSAGGGLFRCPPEKAPLAASWFPLPLSMSRADQV